LSVTGPIAPTARSLTLLFKAVLGQKPWLHDPLALELPWRDEIVQETRELIEKARDGASTLAFGIMKYDGVALVHPPIARGLKIVEKTLQRLGHRVIEWKPPSHAVAAELLVCTCGLCVEARFSRVLTFGRGKYSTWMAA
jgi:Asp-tRNAAsn/Glu-tRNAGln amidotransferase A subunit and related amidases